MIVYTHTYIYIYIYIRTYMYRVALLGPAKMIAAAYLDAEIKQWVYYILYDSILYYAILYYNVINYALLYCTRLYYFLARRTLHASAEEGPSQGCAPCSPSLPVMSSKCEGFLSYASICVYVYVCICMYVYIYI